MKKAGIAAEGVTLKLKTADFRILTRARRLNTPTRSGSRRQRRAAQIQATSSVGERLNCSETPSTREH